MEKMLRLDLDLRASLGQRIVPDAVILQEDRNLLMGSVPLPDADSSHELDQAYLAIRRRAPLPLGRYLVQRASVDFPWWIYQAVVHDFENGQTCRPGDVRRAFLASVLDAFSRGCRFIATVPLGMYKDRGLGVDEMVAALDAAISEIGMRAPWAVRITILLADVDELEAVSHRLRSHILNKASRRFRTVDGESAVVEVLRGSNRLHYRFVPGSLSGYMVARSVPV